MNLVQKFRLALMLGSVVLLNGCWNFFGGGWLWSETTEGQKVTVGFEGSCSETPNANDPALNNIRLDVAFTFHDHGFTGEGVYDQSKNGKKHMTIEAAGYSESYGVDGTCADWSEDLEAVGDGFATGSVWFYCPPGVGDPFDPVCGTAYGRILDTTHNGPDKGDEFCLEIYDGFYAGYTFGDCDPETPAGRLQGGNFTVESVIE